MPNSLMEILPFLGASQASAAPALVAGVLALAGLVLWGAGIRVARIMTAGLFGLILAAVGMYVLPSATGVSQLSGAGIGLAAGFLIGLIAFRFLQAAVLALCLGVAVAGGYYQSERGHFADKTTAVQPAAPSSTLSRIPASASTVHDYATARKAAGDVAQSATAKWEAIPSVLRWRMALAGIAAAVFALAIAWLLPRHVTWIMTASLGAGLVIVAGYVVLGTYVPTASAYVPRDLIQQLECAGGLVVAGMLLQRLFFWPRKALSVSA